MKLVFLGTGGSWPSRERNVSSIALKMNGEIILLDCGEGTQRQLMQSSLSFMRIKKILISHFHGDHFLGVPGLIQSMYLNERSEPLEIFGPKGTTYIINSLLSLGYFNPTFDIITHDLKDKDNVVCEGYEIKIRSVDHGVPTLAFCIEEQPRKGRFNQEKALELGIPEGPLFRKLQEGETIVHDGVTVKPEIVMGEPRKGRKIVYSGDTKPTQAVIELAKDCDVLIHDATLDQGLEEKASDFGHSSAAQAAFVAKEAGVKVLFLTHISPRYKDGLILEDEAKKIFQNSYLATDFLEYDVVYP